MNKYLLVGLCLLAFAAGGAAQLALHRSSDTKVKAEFAAPPPEGAAAPAPAEKAAEAPPQPTPEAEILEAEVTSLAAAEDKAEAGGIASETGAGGETPEAEAVGARAAAPRMRRAPAVRKAARRSSVAPARAAAPPPVAYTPRPRASGGGDGLKETAVGGVKKTGRLFRKGVKKIGGVFH